MKIILKLNTNSDHPFFIQFVGDSSMAYCFLLRNITKTSVLVQKWYANDF